MSSSSPRSSELPAIPTVPSSSSSSSSSPTELATQWLWRMSTSSRQPISSAPYFHEGIVLKPLKVLIAQPGRFVCSLLVPAHLTNSSQELHQGVIASLVDNVGAAALVTLDGKVRLSVDLNVSYASPAHIDDEVEIEAKVLKYTKSIGVVTVDLTKQEDRSTGRSRKAHHVLFCEHALSLVILER